MDDSQPIVLLLGPTDLQAAGASVAIGGTKVRGVLGQLALSTGRVLSSGQLIDGLWGEDPPATATNTLQYHVTVLRKALAKAGVDDAVATRPPGYQLNLPTDVTEFHRHTTAGDAAVRERRTSEAAGNYADALACWRGPALVDLLAFPFANAPAVALEEERQHCVESWVEASLQLGAGEGLVAELELLVATHPTRERLWEHLMVALYRSGRQADALAAYDRARRILDDELGIEPGPGLRKVHSDVLKQDTALLGTTRHPVTTPAAATRLRSTLPVTHAFLVLPDGNHVDVEGTPLVIGRDSSCDLAFLADDQISRRHATIHPTVDGHAVEDLTSTNGTQVNGTRITHMTRLAHGDRLEIGTTVLRYEMPSSLD